MYAWFRPAPSPSIRVFGDAAGFGRAAPDQAEALAEVDLARAVLDADVLISAVVRPSGPPGQILDALLSRQAFEFVFSFGIVAEVERALDLPRIRKHLTDPQDARLVVADIVAVADLVDDTGRVTGLCRDPEDGSSSTNGDVYDAEPDLGLGPR
jgi:PIN domain